MKIEVDVKYLKSLFNDFVGNTKVMFNFKTDGSNLYAQMLGDYTVEVTMPVKSLDGDNKVIDTSFYVTKAIAVMDNDKPVVLTFTDAVLVFEQDTFMSTFLREHEERREYPNMVNTELKDAYANRLKYITHSVVSCLGLAKELMISDPDPMFVNGKVYVDFRQTFFIESLNYPEICIVMSTLKDMAYKLDENTKYCYLEESNMMYFKSNKYEFWVPTNNYNISGSIITAIDKKLIGCTEVTELSFVKYVDKLSILAGAFPKQRMGLSFGDGSFSVSVNNNDMQCSIGDIVDKPLLGLNVTSGQIAVIAKLFKDNEKVKCLRGGNCICLSSGEKNLLIAGLVY